MKKMNVTSHLTTTSSIVINPLKKDENADALKTFEEVIRTCIGPHGKLKIVQNVAGGHVTVTSSSQRLLHIISIKNTFLKLIASSAKVHTNSFGNGGLSCLFLMLNLINNSLTLTHPLPLIGKLYEYFGKIYMDCLKTENNSCVISLDLCNLTSFQSIVQTVLQSKPGCILREDDVHHLSLLLMKIFLNAVPCIGPMISHRNINFVTLEGTSPEKSQLYEGLLIKFPETSVKNLICLEHKSDIKIILFTTSLSGDAKFPADITEICSNVPVWEAVLNFLRSIIQQIIKSKGDIFACQKVVHPLLRKQLEDANILVLDRLGYEISKHLEYISGSTNGSLFGEISIGSLSCISKETIGKSNFLLLSNKMHPFWTMLICNFNEQAVNETKVVCQQSIGTLFRLLKTPVLCYGAGCTEIYTSRHVEKKVTDILEDIKQEIGCTTSQVLEILQSFLQCIANLAIAVHQGSGQNFVTETVHNHLWKLKDGKFPSQDDKCVCGQYTATDVNDCSWSFLSKSLSNVILDSDINPDETQKKVKQFVILDELSSKINAYSVAFETASLLLRVAVCING